MVVLSLILLLSGGLLRVLLVALHDYEVVVAIRCYHHVVDFASDSQKGQIVLRVEVAYQASGGYRQLGKAHGVPRSLRRFAHRRPYNLRLVALLHLCLFDDNQALDALMSLDSRDSLLNFTLNALNKSLLKESCWLFLTVIFSLGASFCL